MNPPTSIALAAVGLAVVVWAAFAFVMWDWNPGNWSECLRMLAAIAWASLTTAALGVVVQYITEKKP